jgi:DNA-binding MarR family transcriptional regulator
MARKSHIDLACRQETAEARLTRKNALRLDDYLPYLVNRVGAALVERFSRRALAAHSLGIDMWRVLAVLSDNGGQRQIDLADIASIEASTVSRIVTRLVRHGLVTRSRSEKSSREVQVQLSLKGRALVKKLIPIARRLEAAALDGIAPRDLALVKKSLRRIYGNLSSGE